MRAHERSEPRHAQAERPNGTDTCRVAPTERSSGRASAVSNTYWLSDQASERSRPEKAPSGAKNPDRKGLDFDGEVSEIKSSSRPTACVRSWYAAALCRFLLSSMVYVTVPFLVFSLGLSCACADGVWCASRLLSLAVFGFLPGGGTRRRSDAVTGQYLYGVLVLFVLANKRYDETRPLSVSCTRARVTFPRAQVRVSRAQRYLGRL